MKNKAEKKRKRRISSKKTLTKIILSLVVVALLGIALISYVNLESQIERLQARKNELSVQAEAALEKKKENEALLEKSDSLEYIEKIAREQLGMVKPGETVFPD